MIVITIHEDGSKFHVHHVVDGKSMDITEHYECRYFPLEDERGRVDGFHVGRRVGRLAGKAAVVPGFLVLTPQQSGEVNMLPQSIDVFGDDRAVGKEL